MADDYTPTTQEVRWDLNESDTARDRFGRWGRAGEAFDRWLAAHDAEKRAEWEAGAVGVSYTKQAASDTRRV